MIDDILNALQISRLEPSHLSFNSQAGWIHEAGNQEFNHVNINIS